MKGFAKYTLTIDENGKPTIKNERGTAIKPDNKGVYGLVNDTLKKRRV